MWVPGAAARRDNGLGPTVASTLLGSAGVHATVVEEHLDAWTAAGAFFLALVIGETLLAVAALRMWRPLLAWLVTISGLLTLATWSVSRTVGMPVGPAAFRLPEAVGTPDLVSCALEVAAVALSVWTLRGGPTPAALSRPGAALTCVVVVAAITTTGWGLRSTLTSDSSPTRHHERA